MTSSSYTGMYALVPILRHPIEAFKLDSSGYGLKIFGSREAWRYIPFYPSEWRPSG